MSNYKFPEGRYLSCFDKDFGNICTSNNHFSRYLKSKLETDSNTSLDIEEHVIHKWALDIDNEGKSLDVYLFKDEGTEYWIPSSEKMLIESAKNIVNFGYVDGRTHHLGLTLNNEVYKIDNSIPGYKLIIQKLHSQRKPKNNDVDLRIKSLEFVKGYGASSIMGDYKSIEEILTEAHKVYEYLSEGITDTIFQEDSILRMSGSILIEEIEIEKYPDEGETTALSE